MEKFFQNNKVLLYTLMSVILITLIGTIYLNNNDIKRNSIPIEENNTETTTNNNSSQTNIHQNTWNTSDIYNGGDKVIFNGKIYKAKWWTQGEEPGSNEWGAWELIDSVPLITTEETNSNNTQNSDFTIIPNNNEKLDPSKFKVVGYFPEWKPDKEKEIQYNKLTHINYAFAIPNADGTVKDLEEPDLAKKIIKKAHDNGTKVLLAVGGWEYNGSPLEKTFVEATNSDEKCQKLANSILDLVDEYDFDGVDMDWEHPRTDGNSKTQYTTLLKYLREGLNKRNKLLTAAVLSGVNPEGGVLWDAAGHTDEALSYLDWINVMAYDGGDGDRHSSYNFALHSANYWLKNRNLPKSKVVLGLPFYGRPSWASYEDILKADINAHKKDVATIDGKEAHYNGIDTIKKKTEWAFKNTSGVMIWEITQDTTDKDKSLLNAIYEVIK